MKIIRPVQNGGKGARVGRGELTVNDLMLLREGSNGVWKDACRVWDEAINVYGCH